MEDVQLDVSLPRSPGVAAKSIPPGDGQTGSKDVLLKFFVDPQTLVLEYIRGHELVIQEGIRSLNPLQTSTLLLVALEGINGDAARGFSRALRKEYPAWIIRVAVFYPPWESTHLVLAAQELLALGTNDSEMTIRADGSIYVPRIRISKPPTKHIPFTPSLPWIIENGELSHTVIPPPHPDHLVVKISAVTSDGPEGWTFMGTLEETSREVAGISLGPVCSHLLVHASCVHILEQPLLSSNSSGPSLLAPIIVALLVGPAAYSSPLRLHGKRLLVVSEHDDLRHQIRRVSTSLGMDVVAIASLTEDELVPAYHRRPDFITSGTRDMRTAAAIQSLLVPSGRSLFWNDPSTGIQHRITSEPWEIGDALRAVLKGLDSSRDIACVPFAPPRTLLPQDLLSNARNIAIFDSQKSYLLIGGIGSLGLHIAIWMYQASDPQLGSPLRLLTNSTNRTGPGKLS